MLFVEFRLFNLLNMYKKILSFLIKRTIIYIDILIHRKRIRNFLINTDLKINAILKNSSTIGSISWNGLDPRIVQLNDIPLSSSVKIGDTIVTGGMSFYFTKGIPIGRIEDYNNTSLEGYYSIDVSIFSDFSSLSNLYILQRTDNEEIKSLLNE